MPITELKSQQIKDNTIESVDIKSGTIKLTNLDLVSTDGVVGKLIAGQNINLQSSTSTDNGIGIVTISSNQPSTTILNRAPEVTDDINSTYTIGSRWIYLNDEFLCVDNTAGNAVWVKITLKNDVTFQNWIPNKTYNVDDIVNYSGVQLRCITAHTSDSNFSNDISKWFSVSQNAIVINQNNHGFGIFKGIYHNGTNWSTANASSITTIATYFIVAKSINYILAVNSGLFLFQDPHSLPLGKLYCDVSGTGSPISINATYPYFRNSLLNVVSSNAFIVNIDVEPFTNEVDLTTLTNTLTSDSLIYEERSLTPTTIPSGFSVIPFNTMKIDYGNSMSFEDSSNTFSLSSGTYKFKIFTAPLVNGQSAIRLINKNATPVPNVGSPIADINNATIFKSVIYNNSSISYESQITLTEATDVQLWFENSASNTINDLNTPIFTVYIERIDQIDNVIGSVFFRLKSSLESASLDFEVNQHTYVPFDFIDAEATSLSYNSPTYIRINNNGGSSLNSPYHIRIPNDGLYQINVKYEFTALSTTTLLRLGVAIYKNNVEYERHEFTESQTNNSSAFDGFSTTAFLSADDLVDIRAFKRNNVNCKCKITSLSIVKVNSVSTYIELNRGTDIRIWEPNSYYSNNMIVLYNSIMLRSTISHTSSTAFNLDLDKWIPINDNAIIVQQPSHGLTQFKPVVKKVNNWELAIANADNNCASHFLIERNDDYFLIVDRGTYEYPLHGLGSQGIYSCSETIAGGITLSNTITTYDNPVLEIIDNNKFKVNSHLDTIYYGNQSFDNYSLVFTAKYNNELIDQLINLDPKWENIKFEINLYANTTQVSSNLNYFINEDTSSSNYWYVRMYYSHTSSNAYPVANDSATSGGYIGNFTNYLMATGTLINTPDSVYNNSIINTTSQNSGIMYLFTISNRYTKQVNQINSLRFKFTNSATLASGFIKVYASR